MKPQDIGILIVDDEFSVRDSLQGWFQMDGYRTGTAANAEEALVRLEEAEWDIILLDIKMPGMSGIELQRHIKNIRPDITVIIITAFAAVDTAVQALKDGAFDYICKPIDPDELSHLIKNATDHKRLLSENQSLKQRVEELAGLNEIIGETVAMKNVIRMIGEVANTDATVMIRGESGTGKELVAKAVHMNSSRCYFPLVSINCGAYAETLLEDELFGHEKGAYTGAQYPRKGKLEMADKGTVFLDEVGDIGMKMQMDLLRVLETKRFTRLGGAKDIDVDFRVICATHKDLELEVKEGRFRQDLYYRLNVFRVDLPPLRERVSDIPLIADYLLRKTALSMNRTVEGFAPDAQEKLKTYSWPGNVREVRNVIERALVVMRGTRITGADLSFPTENRVKPSELRSLDDMEKDHIQETLDRLDWNITRAAEVLDINRVTLYSRIKRYGLKR